MKLTLFLPAFNLLLIAATHLFLNGAANAFEVAPQKSGASSSQSDADIAAIRKESQAFADAFNRRDSKAIALLWTVDGEYIDEAGNKIVGREAIEKEYAEFFEKSPKTKLTVVVDSLRLLSATTAIEDGRSVLEPAPEGTGSASYVAVHVKVDGKWLMASVRDTELFVPPANNVSNLDWLVGSWIAEEHGIKTESVCRWIANKNFLERVYTTTALDGSTTSGLQLIGWNPLEGHVQSWNFSPDGGHAVGVWSVTDKRWTAETLGVTGTGQVTTSVNTISPLDDKAYVWQSTRRTLDGIPLPDSDEIILRRMPGSH